MALNLHHLTDCKEQLYINILSYSWQVQAGGVFRAEGFFIFKQVSFESFFHFTFNLFSNISLLTFQVLKN